MMWLLLLQESTHFGCDASRGKHADFNRTKELEDFGDEVARKINSDDENERDQSFFDNGDSHDGNDNQHETDQTFASAAGDQQPRRKRAKQSKAHRSRRNLHPALAKITGKVF